MRTFAMMPSIVMKVDDGAARDVVISIIDNLLQPLEIPYKVVGFQPYRV